MRTLIAILAVAAIAAAPAAAQEQRKSRNLFEFLFGGGGQSQPVKKKQPVVKKRAPHRSDSRAAAPAEPATPAIEKSETARVVLVVGDFMAGGLADGLATVFEENPDIRVEDRATGSSGFVRDDVVDWPAEIGAMIDEVKPAAVVAMLGSNDRQQIATATGREQLLTDAWEAEYEARLQRFAAAVTERKVPLVWVGLPAFKQKKMLSDMLVFNDFYRQAAEAAGGSFVDIWDGFVDENGGFILDGPDVNGQTVRLRGSDGIVLTRAGKRKVAFYVEKPLFKALGISGASGTVAPSIAALPDAMGPRGPLPPPDRTLPISLDDPGLDGSMDLLGAVGAAADKTKTAAERLAEQGLAPDGAPGRADDFSGAAAAAPRSGADGAMPAGAGPAASPDRTSSVGRR